MIDADAWIKIDEEIDGSTPDICWVVNKKTKEKAIFKPDIERESDNEYCTHLIASYLGISCAKIELGTLFGTKGCLSYDAKDLNRYRYSDGYSLCRCDKLFNNKKSDSNNIIYDNPVELSFIGLSSYMDSMTQKSLIEMIYLDWLVRNSDRHPGNYSFYINRNHVLCGLMPLYDHGACLAGSYRDVSLFAYKGLQELSHKEMLKLIYANHTAIVEELSYKVEHNDFMDLAGSLGYYDYFKERLAGLKEVKELQKKSGKVNVHETISFPESTVFNNSHKNSKGD